MDFEPIRFINEHIRAFFDKPPLLEKKPGCPTSIFWRDEEFCIQEIISEWHEYERRGRMSKNMRSSHASTARSHGSWGVGQDYYRVKTDNGRIFDIYFDRAPQDTNHRKGNWFIYRELKQRK